MKVSDGDLAEEGLDLAAEHGDRALNRARGDSTVSVELRVAVAAPATSLSTPTTISVPWAAPAVRDATKQAMPTTTTDR